MMWLHEIISLYNKNLKLQLHTNWLKGSWVAAAPAKEKGQKVSS
jgi:hypothetical protein